MKKNFGLPLLLGLIFSAFALYFAFRNVPFSQLIDYLYTINYIWVIPSIIIVLLSFIARAYRWQVILASSHKIGFWQAFHPLMIGFMLNCILPARLGELARPAILLKNQKIPFSVGLATVATERLFDLILIIFFFAGVLSFVEIDPNFSHTFGDMVLNKATLEAVAGGTVKLCFLLIAGVILISLDASRKAMINITLRIPNLFFFAPDRIKNKIESMLCKPAAQMIENFAQGFKLVKHPKKMFICLFVSFIVWILAALSYYVIALGCPGMELSFFEISAMMIIICFFIALPSVPGFWGLWEAGGIFALYIFGIPEDIAGGYTLASHAIQIFPVIIAGILSAFAAGVNIRQIQYQEKKG